CRSLRHRARRYPHGALEFLDQRILGRRDQSAHRLDGTPRRTRRNGVENPGQASEPDRLRPEHPQSEHHPVVALPPCGRGLGRGSGGDSHSSTFRHYLSTPTPTPPHKGEGKITAAPRSNLEGIS